MSWRAGTAMKSFKLHCASLPTHPRRPKVGVKLHGANGHPHLAAPKNTWSLLPVRVRWPCKTAAPSDGAASSPFKGEVVQVTIVRSLFRARPRCRNQE